jgi:polysaccharide export outer membrane protein
LLQERSGLPEYEKGEYEQYHLQKNDELELRVISMNPETALLFQQRASSYLSNSSSSFTYRIYEDGTIDVPYVSKVEVVGLTLLQAEQKLEEIFSGFGDDIRVKLALSTGTFCVIGDAGRGYFPIYKDRLTIYQALALCGGANESADFGRVKILRKVNEETKIIEFDIRPRSVIESEYYYVYPNDVIYFDFSKRRFWAIDSYSGFLSIISSSLSMLVSVWNTFN